MTPDQSKRLSPDDRLMFEGNPNDLGTVRRVDAEGVLIDWDCGIRTPLRFDYAEYEESLWPAIEKATGSRVTEDDRGDAMQAAERDDRFAPM